MKHLTWNITSYFSMKFICDRRFALSFLLAKLVLFVMLKDIEMWTKQKKKKKKKKTNCINDDDQLLYLRKASLLLETIVSSIESLMMFFKCSSRFFFFFLFRSDRSQTHDNTREREKEKTLETVKENLSLELNLIAKFHMKISYN